jgi:hypothetical protein
LPVAEIGLGVGEGAAHAVQLVYQVQDDVDAFIVDAELRFEIPNQPRPRGR